MISGFRLRARTAPRTGPIEIRCSAGSGVLRRHLQRVRLRVRIWFSLTFVLSVLFTVEQVRRMGFRDPASLAHLGALLPCTSALFWLVWSRHYGRFYQPASRVLVTVFCALISVFIARAVAGGREVELSGLAVNLIAVFFFAGLRFGRRW